MKEFYYSSWYLLHFSFIANVNLPPVVLFSEDVFLSSHGKQHIYLNKLDQKLYFCPTIFVKNTIYDIFNTIKTQIPALSLTYF